MTLEGKGGRRRRELLGVVDIGSGFDRVDQGDKYQKELD